MQKDYSAQQVRNKISSAVQILSNDKLKDYYDQGLRTESITPDISSDDLRARKQLTELLKDASKVSKDANSLPTKIFYKILDIITSIIDNLLNRQTTDELSQESNLTTDINTAIKALRQTKGVNDTEQKVFDKCIEELQKLSKHYDNNPFKLSKKSIKCASDKLNDSINLQNIQLSIKEELDGLSEAISKIPDSTPKVDSQQKTSVGRG